MMPLADAIAGFHLKSTRANSRKPTQSKETLRLSPAGYLIPESVWQKRFYDFNLWSERKRIEKLRYMHRNPVKRGLVERPDQWRWSSFRAYYFGEPGLVRVNFQEWPVKIKARPVEKFSERSSMPRPLIRKVRE